MQLTENAIAKVEKLADNAIGVPLTPINSVLDKLEEPFSKTKVGSKMLRRIYYDPSKQSHSTNTKEWASLMGAGSLGSHIPALLSGDISPVVMGAVAGGNAIKGAMTGPLLTGGKDSLLKAAGVPAAVMAAGTPVVNAIGNNLGLEGNIDFMPEARAGAAGGIGAAMWLLRNRKNNNRLYY
jgi:hypothetical protein